MKRLHIAHGLSIAILALLVPQAVQAQAGGSLTPAGPPGKAMKSLDEIEPRTPLVDGEPGVSIDTNGTITISESGSYYLTGNHSSTDTGIEIEASGVSVDLRGFELACTGIGIRASGTPANPRDNIHIQNGTIEGGSTAVSFSGTNSSVVEQILARNQSFHGIVLESNSTSGPANSNTIRNCSISNPQNDGIIVNEFLLIASAEAKGNIIEGCSVSGGISTVSKGIRVEGSGTLISHCTVTGSQLTGISVGGAGNQILSCTTSDTGNYGIHLLSSTANALVENCTISGFTSSGIRFSSGTGSTVRQCQISDGQTYGLYLNGSDGNRITDNTISEITNDSGTAYGVRVSGSDDSWFTGNTIAGGAMDGIDLLSTSEGNFFGKNSCHVSGTAYDFGTDNTYGPIVSTTGELGTSGTDTHPWANFSL